MIHNRDYGIMKVFLNSFYSLKDIELIGRSFVVGNILQYYVDRTVNKGEISLVFDNFYGFVLSRGIFSKINEDKINEIRNKLGEMMK